MQVKVGNHCDPKQERARCLAPHLGRQFRSAVSAAGRAPASTPGAGMPGSAAGLPPAVHSAKGRRAGAGEGAVWAVDTQRVQRTQRRSKCSVCVARLGSAGGASWIWALEQTQERGGRWERAGLAGRAAPVSRGVGSPAVCWTHLGCVGREGVQKGRVGRGAGGRQTPLAELRGVGESGERRFSLT